MVKLEQKNKTQISEGTVTLPPIIMVQWKMGVFPILVSFHLERGHTDLTRNTRETP